ncbi:MAG: hypothetical protein M3Q19_11640 [Pseudomonadota bacterium]|nr:hypothetical protein [Pseudomonadota bacterium]
MARRKRDSEGRFTGNGFFDAVRDRPAASAAVVAGAAGIAAAGAFLWTRRGQIGEALSTGMDRLSELKAERMGSHPTQSEIAEEALTLKETGKKSKGPRGPISQQDIKAGLATAE